MREMLIPAEHWELLAQRTYSGGMIAEQEPKMLGQKKQGLYSVRAEAYRGFLYTSFGTLYGGWGRDRKPEICAYRLLPEAMFTGETTTVYHDEEAILAGLRKRGDHTGFLVSVKGKRMVCAEEVRFILDLPSTTPLSLSEAKSHDEQARRWGWRSLRFRGTEPEWFSLQGHPVVRYSRESQGSITALLWRDAEGEIRDFTLRSDVELDVPLADVSEPKSVMIEHASSGCSPSRRRAEEQLALFG